MQDERVNVTSALVDHPPVTPAFAFRFDGPDRSIVFSGDTNKSDNLIRLAGAPTCSFTRRSTCRRSTGSSPCAQRGDPQEAHHRQPHAVEDVGASPPPPA